MIRRFLCAIGLHKWGRESWLTCRRQEPDRAICVCCYKYGGKP
jgi:hypothetical protein